MTLIEALNDPNLFQPHFKSKSWNRWRTFLKALTAEKPSDSDLELFKSCTGRTSWPTVPSTEATLIVGRRGGKSRILALITAYFATLIDYSPFLAAGERATIAVLASDRGQARNIFR